MMRVDESRKKQDRNRHQFTHPGSRAVAIETRGSQANQIWKPSRHGAGAHLELVRAASSQCERVLSEQRIATDLTFDLIGSSLKTSVDIAY